GARAHITVPLDVRRTGAVQHGCVESTRNLDSALKIWMREVETVLRDADDDVASSAGQVPCVRSKNPSAGNEIWSDVRRRMQMPLAREQRVRRREEPRELSHEVRLGVLDV